MTFVTLKNQLKSQNKENRTRNLEIKGNKMSTKKHHKVKEILAEGLEALMAEQNTKLDRIEKFVQEQLAKINDRNKAVNGFVVGEVKYLMDNKLHNMDLTVDALKEMLAEAGIIVDLDTKLAEKRKEIHERREKAAEENMKAQQQSTAPEQTPSEPVTQPQAVQE